MRKVMRSEDLKRKYKKNDLVDETKSLNNTFLFIHVVIAGETALIGAKTQTNSRSHIK